MVRSSALCSKPTKSTHARSRAKLLVQRESNPIKNRKRVVARLQLAAAVPRQEPDADAHALLPHGCIPSRRDMMRQSVNFPAKAFGDGIQQDKQPATGNLETEALHGPPSNETRKP